ncbi:MAG TPA: c-type cytochrome, partial [Nitrosospira sp.]
VTVAGTPEQVARGEHLAVVLCASCHAPDGKLPLRGGNNMSADAGLPLGDLYPPNITPAGKIKNLTDSDIMRILRTGIAPDGRFTFMATVNARHLTDEDAQAVIAYLRHTPTVQEQTPETSFSMLLALFVGSGIVQLDVPTTIQPVPAVAKAATREYGEYVVNFMDCRSCHGPTLTGDAPPPLPKSPNLTFIVPNWSKEDFITAMRTGVDRNGHHIQPPMPWQTVGQLEDVELAAAYEYLHNLPAVETQK